MARRRSNRSFRLWPCEDLTDQEFNEVSQHYAPTTYVPRRPERAPPAVELEPTDIYSVNYPNGFAEFSDGSHNVIEAVDDAYPDGSDSDNDTVVEGTYPDGDIGAVPACGMAIATLPEAVACEATRGEECVVCMEAIAEGQKLRMPCPNLHRFHESCIFRWLTVNRVCPVCRFALPSAQDQTDSYTHTETTGEETVTGSDAETDEDEAQETVTGSDAETDEDEAQETDTGSGGETGAYTAEETDTGSVAETETDTASDLESESDTESYFESESDMGGQW